MQKNTHERKTNRPKMKDMIYKREIPKDILDSFTKEQFYQYQIWDGIVKRLAYLHPRLLLPLIKEIFDKDYPQNTRTDFLTIEYTLEDVQKGRDRILLSVRADMILRLKDDIYHFECQIKPDSEMIIRMYEYDTQITLQFGFRQRKNEKEDIVSFPQSVIMYLNHTNKTPDVEKQKIRFPNGMISEYTVPIMKIQNYTLDMVQEKNLYYILPLMTYRFYNHKNHKCDINALTEFVKKSILVLGEAIRNGYLTEREGNDIMGYVLYSVENMTVEKEAELRKKIFATVPETLKLPWEKEEDHIRGLIELEKEEGIEYSICQKKLERVFKLNEAEAKEKMDMYWSE